MSILNAISSENLLGGSPQPLEEQLQQLMNRIEQAAGFISDRRMAQSLLAFRSQLGSGSRGQSVGRRRSGPATIDVTEQGNLAPDNLDRFLGTSQRPWGMYFSTLGTFTVNPFRLLTRQFLESDGPSSDGIGGIEYVNVVSKYKVNGTKVLGAQGAAIADAAAVSGTATIAGTGFLDVTEFNAFITAVNALKDKINTIISRLEDHGVIAT